MSTARAVTRLTGMGVAANAALAVLVLGLVLAAAAGPRAALASRTTALRQTLSATSPLAQAMTVIIDQEQRLAGGTFRVVGGRHEVFAIIGEQLGPFHQLPGIEEGGFLDQEILGIGAGQLHHGPVSSSAGLSETS